MKLLVALKQINSEQTNIPNPTPGNDNPGNSGSNPTGFSGGSGNDFPGGNEQAGAEYPREGQNSGGAPSNTRFFMSAKLDNTRVIRDVQKLMDEVVNILANSDGSDIEISLEVSAKASNGYDTSTVRAVTENCRTLKVESAGFED